MNCFKNFCLYLVFALTLIAPCAQLFAAPKSEKPQEGRVLFLIETTPATDNDRATIRKSMRSIIESGLDGHLRYGDTIGLWTYNDKVNTDFPMVMWTHEHQQDVENAIDFWMMKQKFKGKPDFSKVVGPLMNVIKSSQKMTIVWYSAGDTTITGTSFDKEINELHKEFRDDFRKQHIPFATVLAVRKGAVVDFTVNPGDATLRLPEVYEKEAAAEAAAAANTPPVEAPAPVAKKPPLIIRVGPSPELLAQKKTNAPAPAVTNAPATNAVAKTQTNAAAPIVQSNASAAIATNAPAPAAAAKPVVPLAQTNAAAVVTNAPRATTTNTSSAVVANTNVTPVATTAATNSVTNNSAKPVAVVQNSKTATSAPPAVSAQPTTAVVAAQPNYTLIGIGSAVLVLVVGGIVFLVKKSSAPKGPSFISQSMTRERFNSDASKPSSDNPAAPE